MNIKKILVIFVILAIIFLFLKRREQFKQAKNLTIVTAYFKINRTREAENYTNGRKNMPKDSHGIYKEWMKGLLSYKGPMVIFTDNETYNYISDLRKNNKDTKIIKTRIEDLYAYNYFKTDLKNDKYATMIWKEESNKNINRKLFTVWNSKIDMLKQAVDMNLFNTFYYAWFDIGYIRDENKYLSDIWPDETKLKIMKDKVLFNIIGGNGKDGEMTVPEDNGTVSGGFIGCSKKNIYKLNTIFNNLLKKKTDFLGNDQTQYTELFKKHKDFIRGIKGKKHSYWKDVWHNEWFYIIPYFYKHIAETFALI